MFSFIFFYFSTDFVDWNVEKCQKGKHGLSSRLSEEIHAVFQLKIVWNGHFQNDSERVEKFQHPRFYATYLYFLNHFGVRMFANDQQRLNS